MRKNRGTTYFLNLLNGSITAVHMCISHKDNRGFKIWHKNPIYGQNNLVEKKKKKKKQF